MGEYLQAKYQLPNIPAPSVPTNVVATPMSSTQASLSWSDVSTTAGVIYTIERAVGAGGFTVIAEVSGQMSYIDTGLAAGETYTYRVKGLTYAGASGYSGTTAVTLPITAPDVPLGSMRLWLRADAGVTSGDGPIKTWRDQSGLGNDATQYTVSRQPQRVAGVLNGRPVVRFTPSSTQFFSLPVNFMSGAAAGEAFVVVKATAASGANRQLWKLGADGDGAKYPRSDGQISETFGTSAVYSTGVPAANIATFNLYNITSEAGAWVSRLNGAVHYSAAGNSVAWRAGDPQLGGQSSWGETFDGDIAEVIIYERALTASEREAVGYYLNQKYTFSDDANFGDFRDINGDRLSDNLDRLLGYDPYSMDVDGDGLSNVLEVANGTDPTVADTDGDGVADGVDAFPLDSSRSQGPAPNPADQTPPVVTLTQPADAVLLP